MPKITIFPLGQVIDAEPGDTIMAAAHAHGLYWPTTCGGEGACTSCACHIDDGADELEPMGRSEMKTLASEFGSGVIRYHRVRLACQARVWKDVTVTKRGVHPDGAL